MNRWQASVLPVILASLASCVVESSPPTPRTPVGSDAPGITTKKNGSVRGECQPAVDRGCFDGFLGSEREIIVEGRRFFNAADLAARFGEILAQEGSPSRRDEKSSGALTLTWITPLSGEGFLVGFEYDLAGPVHRSGRLRTDGRIKLEDLPPDTYDLRIGRPLAVRTKTQDSHETDEGHSRLVCGTLYADLTLDIRESERTWAAIEEFQWHHQVEGCPESLARP